MDNEKKLRYSIYVVGGILFPLAIPAMIFAEKEIKKQDEEYKEWEENFNKSMEELRESQIRMLKNYTL